MDSQSMILGVLLTAGESSRMGRPKALLPYRRASFSRSVIAAFRKGGLKNILAVVGHNPGPIVAHLCDLGSRFIYNRNWPDGQLSSLQAAIRSCPKSASAILVALVDQPGLRPSTVRKLLRVSRQNHGKIVVAAYRGLRGHPVVFPSILFKELLRAPAAGGARSVVRKHLRNRLTVPTSDPAVVLDVDTKREWLYLPSFPRRLESRTGSPLSRG